MTQKSNTPTTENVAKQYQAGTITDRTATIMAAMESIEHAYGSCLTALTLMYGEEQGTKFTDALPFEALRYKIAEYLYISIAEHMTGAEDKII